MTSNSLACGELAADPLLKPSTLNQRSNEVFNYYISLLNVDTFSPVLASLSVKQQQRCVTNRGGGGGGVRTRTPLGLELSVRLRGSPTSRETPEKNKRTRGLGFREGSVLWG